MMYTSKRDVDRHVTELRAKLSSDDIAQKSYTIAKLYYNVGEHQSALKYLDKFDQVRRNSAHSFKLRGQTLEALANISDDGRGNDQSTVKKLKSDAVEAYKQTLDLDRSQTDLIQKVIDLMLDLPISDPERTRYWVEQGNKYFPRNKNVGRLRVKMEDARNLMEGGTSATSAATSGSSIDGENSPKGNDGRDYDEDVDNSILWSAATGGGASFLLNGSRQQDVLTNSTGRQGSYYSTPQQISHRNGNANVTPGKDSLRRFPPRPSPERLQAQVKSVQSTQEKMFLVMEEQNRAVQGQNRLMHETMEALLFEVRHAREEAKRERTIGSIGTSGSASSQLPSMTDMREIHDTVRNIHLELKAMRMDMKSTSFRGLSDTSSVDGASASRPPQPTYARRPVELADLQEALVQQTAQQTALIQMSGFGMLGPLLASSAAVRQPIPPLPAAGIIPHPTQQIAPGFPMPANNPSLAMLDQNRMAGGLGSATLNPWPSSTPTPQQPLPQVVPGPALNTVATTAHAPLALSPANVVITTSDKIPTAEEVKVAAASSNTPIINSVTVPPQHRLGGISNATSNLTTPTRNAHLTALEAVSPNTPEQFVTPPTTRQHNISGGGTLHDYHINLPKGISPLTTSPFGDQDGPAVAVTTTSILSNIPAPLYSAVSILNGTVTTSTKTPERSSVGFSFLGSSGRQRQASVSSVHSTGSYTEGDDHDPRPDFEPIIPLPEEIEVVTGEEDEEILFEDRCKLYRWVDKEWKERGLGQMKLMKNRVDKGKIRILMRREQTLKICANHFLNPDILIDFMKNSGNKAVTWVAHDFADEQMSVEKFSARFKTPEQAETFLDAFKDAQQALARSEGCLGAEKETKPKDPAPPLGNVGVETITNGLPSGPGFGDKFKPKTGSWSCGGCFCLNNADVIQCPACETAKPGHEEEVKAKEKEARAKEEASKPTFSFGETGGFKMSGLVGANSASTQGFAFGQPNVPKPSSDLTGFVFGPTSTDKDKEENKPSPFAGFTFGLTSSTETSGSGVQVVSSTSPGQDTIGDELSLDGQGLKLNTENDAQVIVDAISAHSVGKMKILTLSGNTIGIDAAKRIGQALEGRPELERAHWKDMFTGRMKTEIPPALKHMGQGVMKAGAQLVELDVSDNAFGPIGVEGIVDLLKSPACFTLKELKLNNTGCGVTGGKLLAKTLLEAYHASIKTDPKNPLGLRVFILGRSRQENEGAKALAEVFKLMGTLEEVVMPQNGIYHEGIQALADAFANNPRLRILNMNDNTLTEKGAKHLAAALKKLKNLEQLNLGDCLLRTSGAKLIAAALKESNAEKLQTLCMDSNEMELDAGLAIVDALLPCANLKQLGLDTNHFGDKGCQQIIQKLKDAGKSDIMQEFEDDQGSDVESGEEDENEESANGTKENGIANVTSGLFGNVGGNSSIFGSVSESSATAAQSIFGGEKEPKACTIFGTPQNKSASSIFGGSSSTTTADKPVSSIFAEPRKEGESPSIFDMSKGNASSSTPLFGGRGTEATSIFGQAAVNSAASLFGGNATADKENLASESKGIDLSANKDLSSFASLTASDTPVFGQKTEGFAFTGAGQSLFGRNKKTPNENKKEEDDNDQVEDNEHDPHFEPIIPLPELVQVKTGEEDEDEVFKHRAKVYRFDPETKQWKERGVGDIKILKHPQHMTYRVLLRRDQIHKIACNHLITETMTLQPLSTSETALCWDAMDYAEEEAKMERLAVKFKLAETKNDFKEAFEAAQKDITERKESGRKEDSSRSPLNDRNEDSYTDPANALSTNDSTHDEYEDEEDDEDDDDEDSDSTMFERQCTLLEKEGHVENSLGQVDLRILYDDDVFGARIAAYKSDSEGSDGNGTEVCNHLIAMQTNLELSPSTGDNDSYRCSWSALDFSVDPPKYRSFVAIFSSVESFQEFKDTFYEGKELAEQSEILEQPEATTGKGQLY